MPLKQDRRAAMLDRKRQEYHELLQQYYYIPDTDRGAREQGTLRQILVDIPRTNADVKLFQNERIHQVRGRTLLISFLPLLTELTLSVCSAWSACCTRGRSGTRRAATCRASTTS